MRSRRLVRRRGTLNRKSSKIRRMLKTRAFLTHPTPARHDAPFRGFVLSRPSPCDVPKGYDSVAGLPAALLEGRFEHPTGNTLRDEASGDAYLVSSFTRCPSSGRMSFAIASLTAFSEPGVEKRTRPLMMPAVARLMMAGDPMSL